MKMLDHTNLFQHFVFGTICRCIHYNFFGNTVDNFARVLVFGFFHLVMSNLCGALFYW